MYSIYLRGKVYVHLCTVQIGVRLSTWYVRYNTPLQLYAIVWSWTTSLAHVYVPGTCCHVTTSRDALPFSFGRRSKPNIFEECGQHVSCAGLCQDICQLLLCVDIFDRDVALINLFMKPIILGKKMAVLPYKNALVSAGDSCYIIHAENRWRKWNGKRCDNFLK